MGVKIKCRRISRGIAEGVAIVSSEPISFFGDVNPETGVIVNERHPLFGECIAGKVLVFPTGRGSTVGSYVLYRLAKKGKAPKGIVCKEADPVVVVGAIIADIPMVDLPEVFGFKSGQRIRIDGNVGEVEVL